MDSNEIRVGKISSVDYESGMVRVVYEDQDDAVTRPIPLLSFEYLMPEVDDMVLVLHLSNGTEMGVVMGRPWSEQRVPPENGKGFYRKDFHNEAGKAYLRFAEQENETMTLHVKNLIIHRENRKGHSAQRNRKHRYESSRKNFRRSVWILHGKRSLCDYRRPQHLRHRQHDRGTGCNGKRYFCRTPYS